MSAWQPIESAPKGKPVLIPYPPFELHIPLIFSHEAKEIQAKLARLIRSMSSSSEIHKDIGQDFADPC
jgi:hypothetical protein